MDVKTVLCLVLLISVSKTESGVVFNFHDKLRSAIKTTTDITLKNSQIIRMPELQCPPGYRRDKLRNCREKF